VTARASTPASYTEVAPPPELCASVERLWVHRIEEPPPREGRRLLPDGRINVVRISGIGVQIAGPRTRCTTPPELPVMLTLGAAFRPGAAPQLLRTPASALVDEHVALDAVAPRLAARLDERVGDAHDLREALAALAEELALALRASSAPDPAVRHAVGLLDRGTATIAQIAHRAFVSERELQRRFAEHVGYGPKTLQRVLRFQRFLEKIALPGIDLAGAAALAGYADQAHLSRETRRLADLTPRQLRHWNLAALGHHAMPSLRADPGR
jgi:AraC-like DNA-binding protein